MVSVTRAGSDGFLAPKQRARLCGVMCCAQAIGCGTSFRDQDVDFMAMADLLSNGVEGPPSAIIVRLAEG